MSREQFIAIFLALMCIYWTLPAQANNIHAFVTSGVSFFACIAAAVAFSVKSEKEK